MLHNHISMACKTPSSRVEHSIEERSSFTGEAGLEKTFNFQSPFSSAAGFHTISPPLLRKHTAVLSQDAPADGPPAQPSGPLQLSLPRRKQPRGQAAAGPGAAGPEAYISAGCGDAVAHRVPGSRRLRGKGGREEAPRLNERQLRFAPPHTETLRASVLARADGQRPYQERREGSRRETSLQLLSKPHRPTVLARTLPANTPSPFPPAPLPPPPAAASPQPNNAPAHWAVPALTSPTPIGSSNRPLPRP